MDSLNSAAKFDASSTVKFRDQNTNTGIRIIGVDAMIVSRDPVNVTVGTNVLNLFQLSTGSQQSRLDIPDKRIIVDGFDDRTIWSTGGETVMFQFNGVIPQYIIRDDPFSGDTMSLVVRGNKASGLYKFRIYAKVYYEDVKLTTSEYIRFSL